MNSRRQILKYIVSDFLFSSVAWFLFFSFRKKIIETQYFGYPIQLTYDEKFFLGLIIIPLFWITLHFLSGYYQDVYRRSRLKELWQTMLISIIGTVILFFAFVLDDYVVSYHDYYRSALMLFSTQFILTYIPRIIITTSTIHKIHNRKIGFRTIIVGSDKKAFDLYEYFIKQPKGSGNLFVGFVSVTEKPKYRIERYLSHLGNVSELHNIIEKEKVQEVILALETKEHDQINAILNRIESKDLVVKAIPSLYDILTGSVRMSTPYDAPLIQISRELMTPFEMNLKRLIDIFFSIIAIILLLPVYLFLALGVKMSSKGPIFYTHERIGRYGKPFNIYKFRSMYVDAEKMGPALSSKNDPRITPFGLFMRKVRLDETPQFFNVLKGDMSLVGPRPERQYFIDQIVKKAPHYTHLQKVRPGITSWGQVKFGYAENVDEMIERLKYDLIYMENMSLYVDFKIMIYTIKIIFQGRGK
ncbi:MAG TPA: sugar transferase [Bacteroidales bacterium]|jgi:exopolysaccharide biosynthesis polyprenyl glycosylphosphotransferase|nr:sugar transferase [Bacteroidales bacterium]